MTDHTTNDAAIAHALAREDQERADAQLAELLGNGLLDVNTSPPARPIPSAPPIVQGTAIGGYPGNNRSRGARYNPRGVSCPGGCGLQIFDVSPAQRVTCNVCGRRLNRGERVHSCVNCDYDACEGCKNRGGPPPGTGVTNGGAIVPSPQSQPQRQSQSSQQQQQQRRSGGLQMPPLGDFSMARPQPHMCIVPAIIGDNVCVEMMVDSGAQSSVISLNLAREVGLESRLDRREQGVAAGVGRAKIVGRIRNVVCILGHVEFDLDFMVLDIPDKLLLLGLDLMRKYKCIIDLEKETLVFGGSGGVEVAMLPPNEQHISIRDAMGEQCSVM